MKAAAYNSRTSETARYKRETGRTWDESRAAIESLPTTRIGKRDMPARVDVDRLIAHASRPPKTITIRGLTEKQKTRFRAIAETNRIFDSLRG